MAQPAHVLGAARISAAAAAVVGTVGVAFVVAGTGAIVAVAGVAVAGVAVAGAAVAIFVVVVPPLPPVQNLTCYHDCLGYS